MTVEKLLLLLFTLFLWITALCICRKSALPRKSHLFSAAFGSMGLGALGFGAVSLIGLFGKTLVAVNACTLAVCLLGSLPGLVALLFLNLL